MAGSSAAPNIVLRGRVTSADSTRAATVAARGLHLSHLSSFARAGPSGAPDADALCDIETMLVVGINIFKKS